MFFPTCGSSFVPLVVVPQFQRIPSGEASIFSHVPYFLLLFFKGESSVSGTSSGSVVPAIFIILCGYFWNASSGRAVHHSFFFISFFFVCRLFLVNNFSCPIDVISYEKDISLWKKIIRSDFNHAPVACEPVLSENRRIDHVALLAVVEKESLRRKRGINGDFVSDAKSARIGIARSQKDPEEFLRILIVDEKIAAFDRNSFGS